MVRKHQTRISPNERILVFGTKTAFKYSSEWSCEQYRKASKQPIFLASIDIFFSRNPWY